MTPPDGFQSGWHWSRHPRYFRPAPVGNRLFKLLLLYALIAGIGALCGAW